MTRLVSSLLLPLSEQPQQHLTLDDLPETEAAVYSEFCKRYALGDAPELSVALREREGYVDKVDALRDALTKRQRALTPSTAKELYGNRLSLPPSCLEKYSGCPYSFFCKYGLDTRRLQPAKFTTAQRGTLVHFVLEKLVSEQYQKLPALSEEEIAGLVHRYTQAYLSSIVGYREIEDARLRFLVGRITRMITEVACHLSAEFAQSDFVPQACELHIGTNGDIPAVLFPIEDGTVILNGLIDRVDAYEGYLRVVDYKTNSKEFKLPDTLLGLNLQMLLYLYAVTRGNGLPDEKAAGILYLRAKRDLDDSGIAMSGLLPDNTELIKAMDKNMEGEFVPKYTLTKSGRLDSRCVSFIPKENFKDIFDYIELLMKRTGRRILDGDIAVDPVEGLDSSACKYCDYHAVCGIEDRQGKKVQALKNDEVFERMREEVQNGV